MLSIAKDTDSAFLRGFELDTPVQLMAQFTYWNTAAGE